MHQMRVVLVDQAKAQIRDALDWWGRERPLVRDLFLREFTGAVRRLARFPACGAVDPRWGERGVRRVLLRRSGYFVFYRICAERSVVSVLAVWHSARSRRPRLEE